MSAEPASRVIGTVVCLPVSSVDTALEFYRAVFGIPGLTVDEGIVTVELPGLSLFLIEERAFESYSRKAGRGVAYPSAAAGVGVILSCAVATRPDLDAMLETATAHGGAIAQQGAVDPEMGLYMGYLLDPDGHQWELAHSGQG
ncbi:VOC family protein [Brevibacterium album]|uniref:VOC family protein n=1 Tax=Brevibacterium album TaxID=417948 RepID=UPI00054ED785|nr:VOC family protein [Brevibacterium album]